MNIDSHSETEPRTRKEAALRRSLYLYVLDHLNRNGAYDRTPLPDGNDEYLAGLREIQLLAASLNAGDVERVTDLFLLLQQWMEKEDEETEERLYALVAGSPVILYFRPLTTLLLKQQEALPFALLELARRWLYLGAHRQVVNFAYLLCSLFGFERIRASFSPDLYKDLFTMARCEEFTPALCLACAVAEERPQRELWTLARSTWRFGNLLVSALLDYDTPKQKAWILQRSVAGRVYWPDVSGYLLEQGGVRARLEAGGLSRPQFLRAARLLAAYTASYLQPLEAAPFPFSAVLTPPRTRPALGPLVDALLQGGEPYAADPDFLLNLDMIRNHLAALTEAPAYGQLDPNRLQLLLGRCDALLCRTDHFREVRDALRGPRPIRPELVSLAQVLEIDVWPDFYAYYRRHRSRLDILLYLLQMAGPKGPAPKKERRQRCRALFGILAPLGELPWSFDDPLFQALRDCLADQPCKEAVPYVRAALRSQAFPVRWTGVIILLQWPPQTVTPALRRALSELLLLPDPEEMHARIQTLLDGAQDPEQWRRLALRDQLPPPEPDGDTGTGPTVRPVLLQ